MLILKQSCLYWPSGVYIGPFLFILGQSCLYLNILVYMGSVLYISDAMLLVDLRVYDIFQYLFASIINFKDGSKEIFPNKRTIK